MPSPRAFGMNAICSCAGPAMRCLANSRSSGWPSLPTTCDRALVMSVIVAVSEGRPSVVVAASGACSSGKYGAWVGSVDHKAPQSTHYTAVTSSPETCDDMQIVRC